MRLRINGEDKEKKLAAFQSDLERNPDYFLKHDWGGLDKGSQDLMHLQAHWEEDFWEKRTGS